MFSIVRFVSINVGILFVSLVLDRYSNLKNRNVLYVGWNSKQQILMKIRNCMRRWSVGIQRNLRRGSRKNKRGKSVSLLSEILQGQLEGRETNEHTTNGCFMSIQREEEPSASMLKKWSSNCILPFRLQLSNFGEMNRLGLRGWAGEFLKSK